jgi:hypothetical protein
MRFGAMPVITDSMMTHMKGFDGLGVERGRFGGDFKRSQQGVCKPWSTQGQMPVNDRFDPNAEILVHERKRMKFSSDHH